MKKLLTLIFPLILMSCSHTVEIENSKNYKCGDKIIAIDFLDDDSLILKMNGQSNVLTLIASASGSKYENISAGLIFWNKGSDNYLKINGYDYPQCKEIVK